MAMTYSDNSALAAQGNYGAQSGASIKTAEAPRTLSSAASRLDSLNERLAEVCQSLSMISGQIGALNSVGVSASNKAQPTPSGAVWRLNESADNAHSQLGEIEAMIAGIGRALG